VSCRRLECRGKPILQICYKLQSIKPDSNASFFVICKPILQICYKLQSIKPHYSNASTTSSLMRADPEIPDSRFIVYASKLRYVPACASLNLGFRGLHASVFVSPSCKYVTNYKAEHGIPILMPLFGQKTGLQICYQLQSIKPERIAVMNSCVCFCFVARVSCN
jgi:hypothetical protein